MVSFLVERSHELALKETRVHIDSSRGDSSSIVLAASPTSIIPFDLSTDAQGMLDAAVSIAQSISSDERIPTSHLMPVTDWLFAEQRNVFHIVSDKAVKRMFDVGQSQANRVLYMTPAATTFLHRSECLRVMTAITKAFLQNSEAMVFTESVKSDEVEYKVRGGRIPGEHSANAKAGPLNQDSNDAAKLLNAEWQYGTSYYFDTIGHVDGSLTNAAPRHTIP